MKLRDVLGLFNKTNDREKQIRELLKPFKTPELHAAGRAIINRAETLRDRVKADHDKRVEKNQQRPQTRLIVRGADAQAEQRAMARKEHDRFVERNARVLRARDSMLKQLAGPRQERPPQSRPRQDQRRDTLKPEGPTFRGAAAFGVAALAADASEAAIDEGTASQQAQDGEDIAVAEPAASSPVIAGDEIVPGVTQADIDALTARLKSDQEAGRGIDSPDGPEIEP